MTTRFGALPEDRFRPEYGGVEWIRRLNGYLENAEAEVQAVGIERDGYPATQITQENTFIYWNLIADEMDAIVHKGSPDDTGSVWWFREQLDNGNGPDFREVAQTIGQWCTQLMSIYPQKVVVEAYFNIHQPGIPDELPEDFGA